MLARARAGTIWLARARAAAACGIALGLAGACGGGAPAGDREAAALARELGQRAAWAAPGLAPLYTALDTERAGADWLRELAPELEVVDAELAPGLGSADFARPIVAVVDARSEAAPAFARLLAGGGREEEERRALADGRSALVLRSITGGALALTARPQMHAGLAQSARAAYHPADGGGRAWLELEAGAQATAVAGQPGRWRVVYEAGPLGIARGGALYLQASPFWEWSTPQVADPDAAGYTQLATQAEGVELSARTVDRSLLYVEIGGRALASGERVELDYGAGPAGAAADAYAERGERLWIAVDGDGDGFRKVLADSPRIDVLPRGPSRLIATWPGSARPGERVRLTAAVLDDALDTGLAVEGELAFDAWPSELGPPPRVRFDPANGGRAEAWVTLGGEGLLRFEARAVLGDLELRAASNPLLVSADGPLVRWGDLHGHSNTSDGTGLPEDYFVYARDVAGLDVAALTDHDHWGLLPLSQNPMLWDAIAASARAHHAPGQFVTLLGYEWTSWLFGHRHVLYFADEGQVLSSLDRRYDTPGELWDALRTTGALTIPHHPAGGPIPIDWSIAPDPELEPVVEITSSHGTSEAADAELVIYSAERGHFVRDALERGYRLGVVGSGDSHDGHPGLCFETPHYLNGGLVALLCEELTRAGVREALTQRRVYATNGPRILLRFAVGGRPMGSVVSCGELARPAELFFWTAGTGPIERIDVVRNGSVVERLDAQGRDLLSGTTALADLRPGEFVYLRVLQRDDGQAWSSPIYFVE